MVDGYVNRTGRGRGQARRPWTASPGCLGPGAMEPSLPVRARRRRARCGAPLLTVRHGLRQPARVHGAPRERRPAGPGAGTRLARARDHRDPHPAARRAWPGGAVRAGRGQRAAAARQPVRHGRAGRLGHEPRARAAARAGRAARLPEAAGAARRLARGDRDGAAPEGGAGHEAQDRGARAVPGSGAARRRDRPRPAADPDLLAGRAGAADHLAAGGDQGAGRAARGCLQSRHLPHAGDRAEQHADALAAPSRRRPAPPALAGGPA